MWRIWAAKNQPDLYAACRKISGSVKATVHCPTVKNPDYFRKWGFTYDTQDPVALAAKHAGGPHKVIWPGATLNNNHTIEWRIFIAGDQLLETPKTVKQDVVLLPPPKNDQYLVCIVILGPPSKSKINLQINKIRGHSGYSGNLSDGRGVWAILGYVNKKELPEPPKLTLKIEDNNKLPLQDRNNIRAHLPAVLEDGSLGMWDIKVEVQEARPA